MKITFLGTGTSQGVPVIACDCNICQSTDPKDKRLRSSILVESDNTTVVVDTGPDFRQQMLRANVRRLDAVIFTHEHKDHVAGMDDVRAFNFKWRVDMEVFATLRVQEALKREFHYVFTDKKYPGVPNVNLNTIAHDGFTIGDMDVLPLPVLHHKLPVLGFRFGNISYITDANQIPEETKARIKGSKVLVLNALRREAHLSHFTLSEAIGMVNELGVEQAYFTHISHLLGKHAEVSEELPSHIQLAYDGLQITV